MPHSNEKYDWENWFRKKQFTLIHGKNYVVSQSSMAQQVRNAAAKRGWRVTVIDNGNRLTVIVHNNYARTPA